MKPIIIIASFWLTVLLIPSTSFSHDELTDIPSAHAETGHVYIANRTDTEVVFYLESANTIRTKHHLPPRSGATFSGAKADAWFNIHIDTADTHVKYGLDAGNRYYIKPRSEYCPYCLGSMDVYEMPKR